jgi:hypothetical protein
MGQKVCDNCGETVDEARAFCPACGNAIVEEEQRQEASAFEQMDHTVQMGKTMYGNMLSDMGLNISKAPDAPQPEKRVEVIAPVTPVSQNPPAPPAKKNYLVWIIIGAIALFFLGLLLLGLAGFLFYYFGNV